MGKVTEATVLGVKGPKEAVDTASPCHFWELVDQPPPLFGFHAMWVPHKNRVQVRSGPDIGQA